MNKTRYLAGLAIFALASMGANADGLRGAGAAVAIDADCHVSWTAMSPGGVGSDSVRFLGEKHIGDLRPFPFRPGQVVPIGWVSVQRNANRACAAHVLLGLQAPGLSGKLELSEIKPGIAIPTQRKCTFAPDDGPVVDAQANGLCVFGGVQWQIRAPR